MAGKGGGGAEGKEGCGGGQLRLQSVGAMQSLITHHSLFVFYGSLATSTFISSLTG